jgi:hypothetical protein
VLESLVHDWDITCTDLPADSLNFCISGVRKKLKDVERCSKLTKKHFNILRSMCNCYLTKMMTLCNSNTLFVMDFSNDEAVAAYMDNLINRLHQHQLKKCLPLFQYMSRRTAQFRPQFIMLIAQVTANVC